jgi:hypothetical protein
MDGVYGGEVMACPHCSQAVQFVADPPPVEGNATLAPKALDHTVGALPPVMGQIPLAEMAGRDQDLGVVAGAVAELASYCTESESVLRLVVQSKLMSVSLRPDLVAATNRRIIMLSRGLFSRKMWDSLWVDVHDVQIYESITGASISVTKTNANGARLDKLPKQSAREFYKFCQTREEQMRQVRREHQLQSAAAGASKVMVNVQR